MSVDTLAPAPTPISTARSNVARSARRRVPLSVKLGIALVGIVTLVLLINGTVNLWLNYEEAKRSAVRVQQEKAQAAAERVDEFVSEIESQIGWTTRAEWRRVPLEQQRYDFIRLLRQAPAVTEVSYLDPAGKEQLNVSRLEPDTVGSGKDLSAEPCFQRAVADRVWFGPVYFRRGSEPYMTLAVAHAGRSPGVTVAEVNLKLVWDVITGIKVGEKGYAFVTSAAGRLIAHPDLSLVLRDTDLSRLPQVARNLSPGTGAPDSATSEITDDLSGNKVLTAHARIGRVGWIVFVQSPVTEAMAPVYTALTQSLLLLGLGLLLATLVGSVLARRMVIPIRRLQQGAERLGSGDLSQRIVIRTGDEIETLADRFNHMAGRIQESYETLEGKVEERTRELGESLQQQTATADVLKVISRSAFDLESVLSTLTGSAAQLCGAERGIIALRTGDEFRASAMVGLSDEERRYFANLKLKPGRSSIVPRVALSGKTEHVPDLSADAEFSLPDRPGVQPRATLGVPLLRQGVVEGVFVLSRLRPVAFTPRQIELVETFADQAVIAIENARLFEEVQARTADLTVSLEQQTATADVLKVISRSAFDLQTVFETLIETAARLCASYRGVIFVRRGDILEAAAFHSNVRPEVREHVLAHPLSVDNDSATGRAAFTGQIIQVRDFRTEHDYGRLDIQRKGEYRSLLCVPLMREGEALGVFTLPRTEEGGFTSREVELVQTFADQAVIAIENVRLFDQVQARTQELQASLDDLRTAQDRLVQSEKLASLGQLTAGIAHEIKNPLNFVNNFSSLSADLVDELNDLLASAALDDKTRAEVDELTSLLKGNLAKVVNHGKRADSIVKNMLLHSREGSGEHRPVDVNALVEESMNLAYHGARAEKPGFNVTLEKRFDPATGEADLYPQEITRVLLNLIGNGFYAASKPKAGAHSGFEPTLTASTRSLGDKVEIRIRDNGTGIPDDVKAKMFNPFFTTKPAGEGTGLGLSLSHDIVVKQHRGSIEVATVPGEYTEFTIVLPRAGVAGTERESAS